MTISARIVADSISPAGVRLTTFELEYPRFCHSELMTHRMFSRNAASSRAIPVNRAIELIRENTAMPIHWGKNQPGMSAKEECNSLLDFVYEADGSDTPWPNVERTHAWNIARDNAIHVAEAFNAAGYHKQIVNRLLEPFTHIKVVLTATEFENFFWLRDHKDAQPELAALARLMRDEYNKHEPIKLEHGDWHVPYYGAAGVWIADAPNATDRNGRTLKEAIAISASCCAQVSYRKLDDSLEKAKDIYKRLVESLPPHFSPMEHQATPMRVPEWTPGSVPFDLEGLDRDAATHLDSRGKYWSGNLRGWCQSRQLIAKELGLEPMTSVPYDRSK